MPCFGGGELAMPGDPGDPGGLARNAMEGATFNDIQL